MTDIEFAKEVAEKVWGWRRHGGVYLNNTSYPYVAEFLPREVNSWAGFGRTVEAMVIKCPSFNAGLEFQYGTSKDNISKIIKATHQAALDAVKEEK